MIKKENQASLISPSRKNDKEKQKNLFIE